MVKSYKVWVSMGLVCTVLSMGAMEVEKPIAPSMMIEEQNGTEGALLHIAEQNNQLTEEQLKEVLDKLRAFAEYVNQ